jgi:SAM-dependent methyltransferase
VSRSRAHRQVPVRGIDPSLIRRLAEVERGVVDESMRGYYDRRAREYDDWWLGNGLFAQRDRPGWSSEVAQLIGCLSSLSEGRVLDVACGTGFLTRHLRGEIVGLDQSPEMVRMSTARLSGAEIVEGDAVPLPFVDGAFDRVFTSHFYGHLLDEERERFTKEARRVGRELVIVESAKRSDTPDEEWQERVLNDGTRHRVYKRFFTGASLAQELGGGEVLHEGGWFVVVAA